MGILVFNNGKVSGNRSYGGTYDGEKNMGDLNNWNILTNDANGILNGTYGMLAERSATLYHTYGPVRGAINKQVDYAVGPGLVFRSQPDWKTLGMTKESAKDWGKDFQKIVHAYFQRLNFYEKQSVLFRSALYGGDSLLFFEKKDGLITDLIETGNNQIDWSYNEKDYTLGIKHDDYLRRQGIRQTNGTDLSFIDPAGDQNVIQFYLKELGRQLRGYPLAYAIINLARNDDTHTDAITHRAVMESIMIGMFESDGTDFNQQTKNMAEGFKKKKGQPTEGGVLSKIGNAFNLGSGNFYTGKKGEKMTFTDLKTPSNAFGPFKEWIWNYVAAATGTPPEVMMSKYSTSFTAHKGALNDFVKSYMKKRKTFERTVLNIVVREIAKDAIQQGYISAPGFFDGGWMTQQAYLQGMYLGPIPGHINPIVEVKAEAEEVKQGFDLRSNKAAQRANEWDNFFPEWEEEQNEYTNVPLDNKAQAVYQQETGGSKDA